MIRVLIVDDEPPARRKLRRFLDADGDVEVVAEAADGPAAVRAIREHAPDLVFLDVRMPGSDGFAVVDALAEARPHVVFATAYAEHAVEAFDAGAVDYLLKPFDAARFRRALDRAKARLRDAGAVDDAALRRALEVALSRVSSAADVGADAGRAPGGPSSDDRPALQRIPVKEGDRTILLPVDEISRLEADGNYVRLHTADGTRLVRGTLTGLEERLDPARFVRVSRSVIVNLDRVVELRDWSHGDRLVVLDDGAEVILSRRYRKRLDL